MDLGASPSSAGLSGSTRSSPRRTVTVVGGGVAGLSAACALVEAGFSVHVVEKRNYLGGRAASFFHPGVGEIIDNCQHVLFGCCTNLIDFYRRIGVADQIHWTTEMTMIEPGGRRSILGPSRLPPPLHSLPRFLTAKAFSWRDKLALARSFSALLRGVPSDSTESLGGWLARHHQTKGAYGRFWHLVIASALNADLESISLPYAAKVIRELFLNSAEAGKMGMSRLPLRELYARAVEFIQRSGSQVSLNVRAEQATWDETEAKWTLQTSGAPVVSDFLVLALPFEALAKLLPQLPPTEGTEGLAEQLAAYRHWPICSAHLWFDREITSLEHAVLLDRDIHWMYNKSRLQPERKTRGSYLEIVVSASRRFAAQPQEQALAQATGELAEFFPAVKTAKLEKVAFVKEVHATFGVAPGIDAARPSSVSPWPHCFLAGDWIATGWPSTMESAARSGHLAAEKICDQVGHPRSLLARDLSPRGLMRLFPTAPISTYLASANRPKLENNLNSHSTIVT